MIANATYNRLVFNKPQNKTLQPAVHIPGIVHVEFNHLRALVVYYFLVLLRDKLNVIPLYIYLSCLSQQIFNRYTK